MRDELPCVPASVRAARRLADRTLQDWQLSHLAEDAALLMSEVVTNALLHARSEVAVEIRLEGDVVRFQVSDGADRPPERRRHGLQAGTGRGLWLLDSLAARWGSEPAQPPYAKSVWFELPVDQDPVVSPG